MPKRITTFRGSDGILTGYDAAATWKAQVAHCDLCNAGGDADKSISGSCMGMPATWLGCPYGHGKVGSPLIYRLPSQMDP